MKKCGTKWIDIVLPPAAMGPVVALIGLELSATAANNAGLIGDNIQMVQCLVIFNYSRSCNFLEIFVLENF